MRTRFVRTVARQEFDVFDGQIELAATLINKQQAIMRLVHDVDGLQTLKASDAMINMHNKITRRQARSFGKEVRGAFGAALTHQPVAQYVLFADEREIVGFNTGFDAEDNQRNCRTVAAVNFVPALGQRNIFDAVFTQHILQPVAGAH